MMLQDKEVTPESEDISTVSSRDNITAMTSRSRIMARSAALQRIGSQQDRWKRQAGAIWFQNIQSVKNSFFYPGSGAEKAYLRPAHNVKLN